MHDRGKVLDAEQLEKFKELKGKDWGRYQDVDGDAIPYRTLPGTHPTKGAFFTRGTSHDENARYTEDGRIHARVLDRIRRKFDTAATLVPKPEITIRDKSGKTGLIYFGANTPAVHEALDLLEREGVKVNALRIKAFPFTRDVDLRHARARSVVEQNRDAQMRSLLMTEAERRGSKQMRGAELDDCETADRRRGAAKDWPIHALLETPSPIGDKSASSAAAALRDASAARALENRSRIFTRPSPSLRKAARTREVTPSLGRATRHHELHRQTVGPPSGAAEERAGPHAARLRRHHVDAVRGLRARLDHRGADRGLLRDGPARAPHRQGVGHRLLVEGADLFPLAQPRLQLRARAHAVGHHGRRPSPTATSSTSAFPATATRPRSGSASSATPCAAA